MPRPKRPGAPEPKKRSRNGCWPCKARKVKCGEEKPNCLNCERQGEECDYSIRLNWEGRSKRKGNNMTPELTPGSNPSKASGFPSPITPKEPAKPSPAPTSISAIVHDKDAMFPESYTRRFTQLPQSEDNEKDQALLSAQARVTTNPWETTSSTTPNLSLDQGPSVDQSTVEDLQKTFPGANVPEHQLLDSIQQQSQTYQSPGLSVAEESGNVGTTGFQNYGQFTNLLPSLRSHMSSEATSSIYEAIPPYSALLPDNRPSKRMRFDSLDDVEQGLPPTARSPQEPKLSSYNSFNASVDIPVTPEASSIDVRDVQSPSRVPLTPREPLRYARHFANSRPSSRRGEDRSSMERVSSFDAPAAPRDVHDNSNCETYYGIDRGLSDLDLGQNDDANALNGTASRLAIDPLSDVDSANDPGKSRGGYYASPVSVLISKSFEPLPPTLLENPINLLYFHFFLNNTAKILVTHNCSQNPFTSILPRMAIRDTNLLFLLLAYAASHRARFLKHDEPVNRIAVWVRDVFPSLCKALENSEYITNANLATTIMLTSLEIISPNTFEVPIPWQTHLHTARRMIRIRQESQTATRQDTTYQFLSQWFAYLDVLGSLSSPRNDVPLYDFEHWNTNVELNDDVDFRISCVLGFTSRCVSILGRIANVIYSTENERFNSNGDLDKEWRVSPMTAALARDLELQLLESLSRHHSCPHRYRGTAEENGWEALEMVATNEAFHWAGWLHLHRRVLGKPEDASEVKHAATHLVSALFKIRKGSPAEACLLFPIFTAGCEATEEWQRERIMDRLRRMEGSGMTQIHRARELLKKVWESGKPFQVLVDKEFIG